MGGYKTRPYGRGCSGGVDPRLAGCGLPSSGEVYPRLMGGVLVQINVVAEFISAL